jgi:hypothetical protein
MGRVAVDSTSIASIDYDRRSRELEIEFRQSRDIYRYSGVSVAEHAEFMIVRCAIPHNFLQLPASPRLLYPERWSFQQIALQRALDIVEGTRWSRAAR